MRFHYLLRFRLNKGDSKRSWRIMFCATLEITKGSVVRDPSLRHNDGVCFWPTSQLPIHLVIQGTADWFAKCDVQICTWGWESCWIWGALDKRQNSSPHLSRTSALTCCWDGELMLRSSQEQWAFEIQANSLLCGRHWLTKRSVVHLSGLKQFGMLPWWCGEKS